MDLTEKELSSEIAYDGGFLKVRKDTVSLPDGTISTREFISHPGASMVIPVTTEGKLIMIRQFRYPLKKVFVEFPAGKIDKGEEPLKTAQRELLEETGYIASDYKHLVTFHPTIGYADEKIAIYVATGLKPGPQKLDHGEFLEVFELGFSEAMQLMKNHEITDSKSMIGLFWYQQLLNNKW
jgi:ADP-ribose pyrophosphatase